MDRKRTTRLLMLVGGVIGSYVPALWGAAGFTMSSILCGGIGAIVGIWIAFRLTRY